MAAVRRSCQTMARWRGRPVRRSQGDQGLALVGDADGGHRSRRPRPGGRPPRPGWPARPARSLRRRARPSPGGGSTGGTPGTGHVGDLAVLVDGHGPHAGRPGVDGDDHWPWLEADANPWRGPPSKGRDRGPAPGYRPPRGQLRRPVTCTAIRAARYFVDNRRNYNDVMTTASRVSPGGSHHYILSVTGGPPYVPGTDPGAVGGPGCKPCEHRDLHFSADALTRMKLR